MSKDPYDAQTSSRDDRSHRRGGGMASVTARYKRKGVVEGVWSSRLGGRKVQESD